MFTFSTFDWKYLFGQIWSKKSNSQFELKFCTRLIWICRIMWKICGVNFFCFRPENPFWENLVQKIKIVSLSGNLVPRLIWICGIQWLCSLFQFLIGNTFLGKFDPKYQNCLFKVKFDTKTNFNMKTLMVVSILSVLDWK